MDETPRLTPQELVELLFTLEQVKGEWFLATTLPFGAVSFIAGPFSRTAGIVRLRALQNNLILTLHNKVMLGQKKLIIDKSRIKQVAEHYQNELNRQAKSVSLSHHDLSPGIAAPNKTVRQKEKLDGKTGV